MKTHQSVLPWGVRVIDLDHSQNEYIRDEDLFPLLRKYCGEDAIEIILEKRKSLWPGCNVAFSPPTYWIKVQKDGKKRYSNFLFMGTGIRNEIIEASIITAPSLDLLRVTCNWMCKLAVKFVKEEKKGIILPPESELDRPELN
jgi:hypothetical protein